MFNNDALTTTDDAITARLVSNERLAAISSMVAEGAVFEGNFHANRDLGLRVDGKIVGNVIFENGGAVHVGAAGVLENATIEADHIFIEGRVSGFVIARKTLEISGSATVVADVHYDNLLDIHPRARIKGKLEFRGDLEAQAQ